MGLLYLYCGNVRGSELRVAVAYAWHVEVTHVKADLSNCSVPRDVLRQVHCKSLKCVLPYNKTDRARIA